MKKIKIMIIISFLLILVGCGSKKEISYEEFESGEYPNYTGYVIDRFENGKIASKGFLKNGNPDGEFIVYYESGSIQMKGKFKEGILEGEKLYYYENGSVRIKANYKNDEVDGEVIFFDEYGNVERKEILEDWELELLDGYSED